MYKKDGNDNEMTIYYEMKSHYINFKQLTLYQSHTIVAFDSSHWQMEK